MGYLHIDNLYKNKNVLLFKEVYASEKIHGTSANISWDGSNIIFYSGGASYEEFITLFDKEELKNKFLENYGTKKIVIYGEAYGGKVQKMSTTYGTKLKFIVFDVKCNDAWFPVPAAEKVADSFGLEFVSYCKVPATREALDVERLKPSVQAKRNGIIEDKKREGIVIRPLVEMTTQNGERVIAKYKNDDFIETKTKRDLSAEKLAILEDAREIAEEWVTPMRLEHVLDKLNCEIDMKNTGMLIKAMIEDISREAKGEIAIISPAVNKEINKKTIELWKEYIRNYV